MKKQLIQFVGVVGLVVGWQGGAIAQTAAGLPFEETFRTGTLLNPDPNAYTVSGTKPTDGTSVPSVNSVCLTGSTNQTQTPVLGCLPGTPSLPAGGDTADNGALRLTSNVEFRRNVVGGAETIGEEGFFVFNKSLPTNGGLIFEFDFFTYNGQTFLPLSNPPGGDGFSFFLIDDKAAGNGALDQRFSGQAGGFGGSLGYAQRRTGNFNVNGLTDGYIGIGFDDFGNFSNNGEGRGEGTDPNGNAADVRRPNSVVLRGGAANNYRILPVNGQNQLAPGSDLSLTTPNGLRPAQGKRGKITLTANNLLSLEIDGVVVVTDFNLNSIPNQTLPRFFKFGFAAATGTSTAIHEIRNVTVKQITPPVVPPVIPPPPPPPPTNQTLRLVKRVTSIARRNGLTTPFPQFVDDPNDPNDTVAGWAQLPGGLAGLPRVGDRVQSGDEVEYTIYYLAEGDVPLVDTNLCDQVPENSVFVPATNVISQNNGLATPNGQVFSKLAPLAPADNPCRDQANPNGSVIFKLQDVGVTAGNNFGFVRFRTKVN
jgi:uncharacterized repeat protein (TIGR01451 family)